MAWHLPSISTLVPRFCHTKHWTRAAIHIPSEKLRRELTRLTRITEKRIFLRPLPVYRAFSDLQLVLARVVCLILGLGTGTWYFLAFSSFMVEHYKEHCHQEKKSAKECVLIFQNEPVSRRQTTAYFYHLWVYCCADEHVNGNMSACSQTVAAHRSLLLVGTGHDYWDSLVCWERQRETERVRRPRLHIR